MPGTSHSHPRSEANFVVRVDGLSVDFEGTGKSSGSSALPAGSPRPSGTASALTAGESEIVLDRLEKEIATLLHAGGAKKDTVRRRLRMGINEVTKFLEATAAAVTSHKSTCPSTSSPSRAPAEGEGSTTTCRRRNEKEGEGGGLSSPSPQSRFALQPAIVLVCRDVRPARLVEHVHALVSLTGTPHLVLSESSTSLGRVFGCKTMAALAICPASSPPPSHPSPSPAGGRGAKAVTPQEQVGSRNSSNNIDSSGKGSNCSSIGKIGGGGVKAHGDGGDGGGGWTELEDGESRAGEVVANEREEAAGSGDGSGSDWVASDDHAAVDEDVDSFVEFLRRKVRAAAPSAFAEQDPTGR